MKRAFTLIEILIVIAIVGLMALAALPMFDQFSANAELNDKTDEIKLVFEKAYREALSPKPGNNAVRVTISSGSSPTVIYETGSCSLNNSCQTFTPANSEEIAMSGKFSLTNPSIVGGDPGGPSYSPFSVVFMSPASSADIYLKDNGGNSVAGTGFSYVLTREGITTQKTITFTIKPFMVSV